MLVIRRKSPSDLMANGIHPRSHVGKLVLPFITRVASRLTAPYVLMFIDLGTRKVCVCPASLPTG